VSSSLLYSDTPMMPAQALGSDPSAYTGVDSGISIENTVRIMLMKTIIGIFLVMLRVLLLFYLSRHRFLSSGKVNFTSSSLFLHVTEGRGDKYSDNPILPPLGAEDACSSG